MGNCCAKRKHLVHPAEPGPQRIKVRMTAARFKELVSQAELSEGDGDIGRLVLEEYLKGSRHDRVISTSGLESKEDLGKFRSLEAIAEEE